MWDLSSDSACPFSEFFWKFSDFSEKTVSKIPFLCVYRVEGVRTLQNNPLDAYRRFFSGDTEAAGVLVAVYSDALVRFADRYLHDSDLSEDAAEDAFIALLLKRHHFKEECQLRAYLYRAVRSRAIDLLRKQSREVSLTDHEGILEVRAEEGSDPESAYRAEERNAALRRCIAELAPQYREVLLLCYFEELDPDSIAEVTKRSKKQVYNLLTRARASLKERLIQEGFSSEDL